MFFLRMIRVVERSKSTVPILYLPERRGTFYKLYVTAFQLGKAAGKTS
jgi:hypothetical protein